MWPLQATWLWAGLSFSKSPPSSSQGRIYFIPAANNNVIHSPEDRGHSEPPTVVTPCPSPCAGDHKMTHASVQAERCVAGWRALGHLSEAAECPTLASQPWAGSQAATLRALPPADSHLPGWQQLASRAGQGPRLACRRVHFRSGSGGPRPAQSEASAPCSGICSGPQDWPRPGTSRLRAPSHLSTRSPRGWSCCHVRSAREDPEVQRGRQLLGQSGIPGKELGPTSWHPGAPNLLAACRCVQAKGSSRHRKGGETPLGKANPSQVTWVHPGPAQHPQALPGQAHFCLCASICLLYNAAKLSILETSSWKVGGGGPEGRIQVAPGLNGGPTAGMSTH